VERHANPNTTRTALVSKADEDAITALVAKVDDLAKVFKDNPAATAQLEAISKRLDAIEKTRQPSNSQGDDQPKTPVQKSLWGGLL
jgi:ABC-type enterochelin transport system substrate-binding protein